jgi:hypothetical protein
VMARALLLAALAGAGLPGVAGAADESTPSVNVNAIKAPEMRSYRSVSAGLDAFDRHHALAPGASLRFRMWHADGGPAGAADGLALRLASDEVSIPVPIDADGRLIIERNQAMYEADASFILNKKNGQFHALPDIRTPGLPGHVRRLGDLRLECRVLVAIAKENMGFTARAALTGLMLTSDWCGKKKLKFSQPELATLAAATIRAGGREQELELNGSHYLAPIGDMEWPDDALIELRYN